MNAGAVPSDADGAPPSTAAPPLAAMDSRLQSYSLRKLCMPVYRLPGSHQQHRSAYQCGNTSCAWLEGGATAGCRQGGEKRQGQGQGESKVQLWQRQQYNTNTRGARMAYKYIGKSLDYVQGESTAWRGLGSGSDSHSVEAAAAIPTELHSPAACGGGSSACRWAGGGRHGAVVGGGLEAGLAGRLLGGVIQEPAAGSFMER